MVVEQASIRDLVETRAPRHGLAPRELWRWALDSIANDMMAPIFPEGTSLDTWFDFGGARYTWRKVIVRALHTIENHLPSNDGWAKNLMLDGAVFDERLEKFAKDQKLVVFPRRSAGRKPTLREDVTSFIAQKYRGGIPAGTSDKVIANAFKAEKKTSVSLRTVRRARGRE
jgi:hypothetical protein